jgi:Xaa-Pro aminopeptidase
MQRMGGGVAILPSAPVSIRSNDVEYRYRQDSDFYYLTGFPEPDALCLLAPEHPSERFVLFVRSRDRDKEVWTGKRFGVEGAREAFGPDAVYPIDKVEEVLPAFLEKVERVYLGRCRDERLGRRLLDLIDRSRSARARTGTGPTALIDLGEILHDLRLFKAPEEISLMRQAAAVSAAAHLEAMRGARAGMHEYEVEALIEFTFRRLGADGPAYPSIVASGPNATVLHYTANNRRLEAGDLLLIDAGAEYGYYCADITRTYPVSPAFSAEQRDLYEVVLRAQKEALDAVRPGARIEAIHDRAVEALTQGMIDLGLLRGERREIIEREELRPFYMHRTSHWLGMDVHDVGLYRVEGASRPLEAGMVLTVEPGLYLAADNETIDPRFRGLGVRIEDDVLVTDSGHEVLTAAVPKEPSDLEALRREAL